MSPPRVTYRLMTPRAGTGGASSGAISVIQLNAREQGDLTRFLDSIALVGLSAGDVRLRDLLGVDRGLVCRWTGTCAQLMPHGGALIVKQLERALSERGVLPADGDQVSIESLDAHYPEARDGIESCALDAIARAHSAEAVDLILDHADRIRSRQREAFDPSLDALGALIDPPVVVCAGPANAGKSSLLNALARREVALVADAPGTTRDHVGVMLDLAGLVVRWMDMPGERRADDALEARARELARSTASGASLVLRCADATTGFDDEKDDPSVIRVGTKLDIAPVDSARVQTSAATGEGLGALARLVRSSIVPRKHLESEGIWRFHPRLDEAVAGRPGVEESASPDYT